MSFTIANLAPIGNTAKRGKASQHWTYWTLDAAADVDGSGYFNSGTAYAGAYHLLEVGDVIHRVTWSTAIGTGTISSYGTHIVVSKSAGTVDISNETDLTETDSD